MTALPAIPAAIIVIRPGVPHGRMLGMWLTQQREARAWTVADIRRHLRAAATKAGDTLPGNATLGIMIRRWERGEASMPDRYRHYYSHALAIPIQDLGTTPVPTSPPGQASTLANSQRAELARLRRENAELADTCDALKLCLALWIYDTTPQVADLTTQARPTSNPPA